MLIDAYNDFYAFFRSLKRLTGIKCAREQNLSLLKACILPKKVYVLGLDQNYRSILVLRFYLIAPHNYAVSCNSLCQTIFSLIGFILKF